MVVCQEEHEFIGKRVAVVSEQIIRLLAKTRLVFIYKAIRHKLRNLSFAHGKQLERFHAELGIHLPCYEFTSIYVIW